MQEAIQFWVKKIIIAFYILQIWTKDDSDAYKNVLYDYDGTVNDLIDRKEAFVVYIGPWINEQKEVTWKIQYKCCRQPEFNSNIQRDRNHLFH